MNDLSILSLKEGDSPILISIPHLGTCIPDVIASKLTDAATELRDTDWHLDRLYACSDVLQASVIQANVSRYVIDLNRPPSGESLYPGQTTTGLCPLETFHGEPLYRDGEVPDSEEIARRLDSYWRPYHAALASQLEALRNRFGYAVLWEAHSINSVLPRLFDGVLPDLNFGTSNGASCGKRVQDVVFGLASHSSFTSVLNGRFQGGYITRHYGAPSKGIHAIQLEMSQKIYMNECAPFAYNVELAAKIQPLLCALLEAAARAASQGE